jgi:hypothetical protein
VASNERIQRSGDRYIALWNETNDVRRRDLIVETFAESASYLDPIMTSEGHAAIDGMVRAVQERFPGHRFRRAGTVDGHHGREIPVPSLQPEVLCGRNEFTLLWCVTPSARRITS